MAFAPQILRPQTGSTMLGMFQAVTAANRKQKELELREQQLAQNDLLKTAGMALKEQALGLQGLKLAQDAALAEERLNMQKQLGESKMLMDVARIAKMEGDVEILQRDTKASIELQDVLKQQDSQGRTLRERMYFGKDDAEKEKAFAEFTRQTSQRGINAGIGKQTKAALDEIRADSRIKNAADNFEAKQALAEQEARRKEAEGGRKMDQTDRRLDQTDVSLGIQKDKVTAALDRAKASTGTGGGGTIRPKGMSKAYTVQEVEDVFAAGGTEAEMLWEALKSTPSGIKGPDGQAVPMYSHELLSKWRERGKARKQAPAEPKPEDASVHTVKDSKTGQRVSDTINLPLPAATPAAAPAATPAPSTSAPMDAFDRLQQLDLTDPSTFDSVAIPDAENFNPLAMFGQKPGFGGFGLQA